MKTNHGAEYPPVKDVGRFFIVCATRGCTVPEMHRHRHSGAIELERRCSNCGAALYATMFADRRSSAICADDCVR